MSTPTASEVWRDYNTDGVPASGKREPPKSDIRSWAKDVSGKVVQSVEDAPSLGLSPDGSLLMGYAAPGDAVPAPYVSRLSEPSHSGKVQVDGVWYELERRDGVYLEDFGGQQSVKEDGTYDFSLNNGDALADAIDYCVKKRRSLIRVSPGTWRFTSGGFILPVGITLIGAGHSSSTKNSGTFMWLDYDETTPTNAFLHWDGSGDSAASTGGGCRGMTIGKASDRTGGTMIKIDGSSAAQRPGYMNFDGLQLSGTQGTAWSDYGIILDGSDIPVSGTQGVRDVMMSNIFIDGQKHSAHLVNATHAKLMNWLVSQGGYGLTDPTDVRITGLSTDPLDMTTDLQATNISITGTLILDKCIQCNLSGTASDLVVTQNCWNTVWNGEVNNGVTFDGTSRYALAHTNQTYIYDLNSLKEGTGYRYTPDGFVEQWGTGTTSSGAATVTFPIPLTNAPPDHFAQLNASSSGNGYGVNSYGATATTLSIRAEDKSGTGASVAFRWKARGIPATSV